jgi:ABC-type glycerol-3-phosphate transport system substrate-binding protein
MLGTLAAGALAACGATPTPQVVEKVVEKEVTKIVEGTPVIVKETVVVKETQVQVVEVTPTAQARTGPVVVTYYGWLGAKQFELWDDWVKTFTDANPDIKVQLIPAAGATIEMEQKLQAMIMAGNSPDILACTQPEAVIQGWVISLQPYIERDNYDLSVFPAAPLKTAMSVNNSNQLYWLPDHMGADNAAWVYNKTIFADAGVEPPPTKWNDPDWTWDEWVARAKAVTIDQNGDGTPDIYGQGDMGYYTETTTMFGAYWCDQNDVTKITTDTPENLEWATRYQDLFCKDKVVPTADTRSGWGPVDVFLAGKVAMSMIGSWVFLDYNDSEIDWDFMPFPKAKFACPTMMLTCAPGILKQAKNPDQAWTFMKWYCDYNRTTLFGGVPSMPKYFDRWAQEGLTKHPTVNTALMVEGVNASLPSDNIGNHPCFSEMTDKVIYPGMQQLELCQITPKEMLTSWQTDLQAISDACAPSA